MNISPNDYDDFIITIRAARTAFQLTPGGNIHFNDILQKFQRFKTPRKELWQRVNSELQSA